MAVTFVVEDGTGLSNATTYISDSDADQLVEDFGLAWASGASADDKKQNLNAATRYIDARYHVAWQSYRSTEAQALDWPRYGVVDTDGWEIADNVIPAKLKQAVVEVAVYRNNNGNAFPDLDNPGALKREKIKIDVLEFEEEYLGGNSGSEVAEKVDALMSDYLSSGGRGANVEVRRG